MKINGALKPRQGASGQGSSPGVVLQKYRVKRYFPLNKNVAISPPANACGVKNIHFTEHILVTNNNNNICINNQQQKTTRATSAQQRGQNRKCGEKTSVSSSSSLSRTKLSTYKRSEQQNNTTISITARSRVSAIIKAKRCLINFNRAKNKFKNPQGTVATQATEALPNGAAHIKTQKKKTNTEAAINITTRQRNQSKVKPSQERTTLSSSREDQVNRINKSSTTRSKKDHKLLFTPGIIKPRASPLVIRQLLMQLKLLFLSMLSHAKRYLKETVKDSCHSSGLSNSSLLKTIQTMCASPLLPGSFERICLKNVIRVKTSVALCMLIYAATAILLPQPVVGDDGDGFFPINGIETTTPEFDYASRGQKKFGDKCENTLECGFPGSICDAKKKSCQCTEDLPVTNHIDKCGKEAAVNESCFFNEQCEVKYFQTECRDQRCVCRFDMTPAWLKDGSVECKGRGDKKGPETYIDPAMIGVLIGMALMFIIICVVLRLFSQARWRENRTIFNTPNPRLMNVSLLRESKLLHGQERRGSRMSVRAPSRQPSMASLRPHSPNPSLGKTGSRSNSHGSNASATSLRSTRSNSVSPAGIVVVNNAHHERKGSTYQPHQHQHPQQQKLEPIQQQEPHLTQTNIISNPVAETVTVEIIEPEK